MDSVGQGEEVLAMTQLPRRASVPMEAAYAEAEYMLLLRAANNLFAVHLITAGQHGRITTEIDRRYPNRAEPSATRSGK